MIERSTSFRQLSPYSPIKSGVSYRAFAVDRIIQLAVPYGVLSVKPNSDFYSSGDAGGPFSNDSIIYTISNTGGAALDWSVSLDVDWLNASATSGSLSAGDSTDITISIVDAETSDLNLGVNEGIVGFVNTTNGHGNTDRNVYLTILTAITFEQFNGPFTFPNVFTDGDGLFYATQTASGTNAVKFAPVPDDPNNYSCISPPSMGTAQSTFSGIVDYDLNTVTATGYITCEHSQAGFVPSAGANYPAFSGTRTISGQSFDNVLANLGPDGGYFLAKGYAEGHSINTFVRQWWTADNQKGYFVVGFADAIYCSGHELVVSLSNIVTVSQIGYSVDTTGVPARTQNVGSFNSGGRSYSGNKSRVRFRGETDDDQDLLSINLRYLVTPQIGSPYYIYEVHEYSVTPSSNYDVYVEYPWTQDSDVYLDSWEFSKYRGVYSDFSSYAANTEYTELSPEDSWNSLAVFGMPAPNSDSYDSFDDFDVNYSTINNNIVEVGTGYGWSDKGVINGKDQESVYDDFEGYSDGDIYVISQGVGWASLGMVGSKYDNEAYDDFEDYPDGAITQLEDGFGWTSSGEIG